MSDVQQMFDFWIADRREQFFHIRPPPLLPSSTLPPWRPSSGDTQASFFRTGCFCWHYFFTFFKSVLICFPFLLYIFSLLLPDSFCSRSTIQNVPTKLRYCVNLTEPQFWIWGKSWQFCPNRPVPKIHNPYKKVVKCLFCMLGNLKRYFVLKYSWVWLENTPPHPTPPLNEKINLGNAHLQNLAR